MKQEEKKEEKKKKTKKAGSNDSDGDMDIDTEDDGTPAHRVVVVRWARRRLGRPVRCLAPPCRSIPPRPTTIL